MPNIPFEEPCIVSPSALDPWLFSVVYYPQECLQGGCVCVPAGWTSRKRGGFFIDLCCVKQRHHAWTQEPRGDWWYKTCRNPGKVLEFYGGMGWRILDQSCLDLKGQGGLSTMISGLYSPYSRLSILNVTLLLQYDFYYIITGVHIYGFLSATATPSVRSLKFFISSLMPSSWHG